MQTDEEGLGGLHDIVSRIYPHNIMKHIVVQALDSGGSHFSSDVKEVKILVENYEGKSEQIYLVLKSLPSWEKQVEHSSKLGLQKEIGFYTIAVPAYRKLQQNTGSIPENLFPQLLYASDHEILLEDLRTSGFSGLKHSLDEQHTLLVLESLAKFHATGVALKVTNADFFTKQLSQVVAPALRNANHARREEINEKFRHDVFTLLTSMEDCQQYAEPVVDLLHSIDSQKLPEPREPFATILHNDLWRGNILFKYSSDKKSVEVRFIDFQTTIFNSPTRELAYFLCTSVNPEVFNKFDQMIRFYHQVFEDYLKKLGCETEDFNLETLISEMDTYGRTKFKHIVLLYKSISALSADDSDAAFKQFLRQVVFMFKERKWL